MTNLTPNNATQVQIPFQNEAVSKILELKLNEIQDLKPDECLGIVTSEIYTRKFLVTKNFDEEANFDVNSTENFISITELLSKSYEADDTVNLYMRTQKQSGLRCLELRLNNITYDKTEYRVATFTQVTESQMVERAEARSKMVTLMASSVTHEMLTPLKCIINFADSLRHGLKSATADSQKSVELISVTAKLILCQMKMLLDNNMMKREMFALQIEKIPINRTVSDAVHIMKLQAEVRRI